MNKPSLISPSFFKTSLFLRAFIIALLLLSTHAATRGERREHVVDAWRPIHYNVALVFNDQLSEITSAETEISINVLKDNLNVLDLDFGEMTIDAVTIANVPARYEQRDGLLNITLPKTARRGDRLVVKIKYHGRPKDGLALTLDKAGKPTATGDNWPNRVHHWIPCLDHPSAKATVNFTVTAPARDLVVSNGAMLATRDNADSTRTWDYSERVPIPAYCMIVGVAEYAHFEAQPSVLTPLAFYGPQTERERFVQGFNSADESLAFLSEKVARYPYEKLALIVGATRFGGMENSSAIVFSSTFFDPRQAPPQFISPHFNIRSDIEATVAHEIAHQWFGDSVTESTWADLWLSEGFATYFAALFIERYEGEPAFRAHMGRAAETYFKYEREHRTPIYDRETVDLFKLLNANSYEKGAWVLHMLRSMLGDEAFFKGIKRYYAAHRDSTATTEDLRAALEKASGKNLKEFFARWIYASGHPRYEAAWTWQQERAFGGTLTIRLRQLQDDAAFLMPFPIEIVTTDKTRRTTLKPEDKESVTRIHFAHRPTNVRFDPDETILKEITVKGSVLKKK
jgi:aminopeptidase N